MVFFRGNVRRRHSNHTGKRRNICSSWWTIDNAISNETCLWSNVDNGAEILAHIGINTVELNGKYFETFVEQGQRVKKGQLLAKFDIDQIGKDYDISTPILLTNKDNYKLELTKHDNKDVSTNDILYKVSKI